MDAKTAKKNEAQDLKRLAENITRWERQGQKWATEGDAEMARTHAKDAKALRTIAEAVKAGDYRHAAAVAYNLDTIVRDQIPARLYNAINR